jgi:hypothetical protein
VAAVGAIVVGAWLSVAVISRSDEVRGDKKHATIGLLPPTPDRLAGIWAQVEGPSFQPTELLIRFGPGDNVVFDDSGQIDSLPAVLATYAVNGNTIRFRTTVGSAACPEGDTWAFQAGLRQDGRLDIVVIEDGTGNCNVGIGTAWTLVRVSPRSAAGALIPADERRAKAVAPAALGLTGIWLGDDGQLLSLNVDMSYAMDDGGELDTSPDEEGEYRLRGRTLTFTSGTGSTTCPEGAVRVWKQLRLDRNTLRGVVHKDECADSVGDIQTWIGVSGAPFPRNYD